MQRIFIIILPFSATLPDRKTSNADSAIEVIKKNRSKYNNT